MANSSLDTGPLTWVKGEIDLALERAGDALARRNADDDSVALAEARNHLHQARGALTIVGLEGVTLFADTLEQLLAALEKGELAWSADLNELAGQALAEIRAYLDGLLAGQPDRPLGLYPLYRDLMLARGKGSPPVTDLFFPDLTQRPPCREREPEPAAPEVLATRLKAARLGYERGLLKWLKSDAKGITEMRNSVAVIEMTQATPAARAFWWVTLAFLDALAVNALADDDGARRLGGRIDAQIRKLLEGSGTVSERLMRDVLHGVALAGAAGDHAACVRAAYRLDELMPQAAPSGVAQAREDGERRRVAALAQEILAHLGGVEQSLDAFFRNPVRPLDLAALAPSLAAVAAILDGLGEARAVAVLREAEAAIAAFAVAGHVPGQADFEAVAGKLSALGFFAEKLPAGGADIDAILQPAPPELVAPSVEAELAEARRMTMTLIGALRQQPADAALRDDVRQNLATLREDALLVADAALEQQADLALAAIDAGHGGERIEAAMAELPALAVPANPAPEPPSPEAVRLATANEDEIDAELLAIFLEEAHEVLATIDAVLPRFEASGERDTLVILRRAFHTLKGSGRMVGLEDLGAAAWAVEQILNGWLLREQAPTAALFALLDEADSLFRDWVAQLASGGGVYRDATALMARCERLRTEATPAVDVPPPPEEVPPPANEEETVTSPPPRRIGPLQLVHSTSAANVRLGNITLTATLHERYLAEAREQIALLQRELGNSSIPGPVLIQAAQGLAAASTAVGIAPVASLAQALARALGSLATAGRTPEDGQRMLFARVAGALEGMLGAVAEGRLPGLEKSLATELAALAGAEAAPVVEDAIDPQLLPFFLDESQDLLPAIDAALAAWRAVPGAEEVPASLKRLLHTLKGSARMAGAAAIAALAHDLESGVGQAVSAGAKLESIVALDERFEQIRARLAALRGDGLAAPGQPHLRVRAELIDRLVDESGEMVVTHSRVAGEVRAMKLSLADLTENVARLRQQLREIEIQADSRIVSRQSESSGAFDPLEFDRYTRFQELTRMMAESVDDVATVQHGLQKGLERANTALAAQARANRELSRRLLDVRMVAFATVAERLHSVVAQTAEESGRAARLEIHGGQLTLDRSLLERITAPLEHLLRNAVGHGIEDGPTRRAAGKPESGVVTVTLERQGNEIAIAVADDGRGLDLAAIRARAGSQANEGDEGDQALSQLIFRPGFSTAASLTATAGRGIGLDVVRTEVAALGGQVDVRTEAGRGACFHIRLPLTLAVTPAVLVGVGDQVYAIAAALVEQASALPSEAVAPLRAEGVSHWRDQSYPFHYLPRLLGEASAEPPPARRHWLLWLRAGERRLCLEVDAVLGNREIVVKNLGPRFAAIPGLAGATVLGDGTVALILDPLTLAASPDRAPRLAHAQPAPLPAMPVVLVVDDSLTVRKITGRLLARQGYQVLTAKDGVDALEQMNETLPAVVLADIEMPRMDGFDLARAIRADARLKHLPIVVISSRSAEKHRAHAAALGVDHFLGKPFAEDELLRIVGDYVAKTTP